ncbi:MAG: LeuD/DmdB family oxidoreductase small subunit [Candidatus Thorarchaeota archaeon]|jgi:3-isopropylmalate/(R)-2-methylmalate dehydratase small subunit
MLNQIKGNARVFGDDINTDQIIQGRYLTLLSYEEMAKHTFEVIQPNFVEVVNQGDIVAAGSNFGSGSSREEAPMVLKEVGISCVVAESFARIFYRNAFNIGLPALIVPEITKYVTEGQELQVDLLQGKVLIVETEKELNGSCVPQRMLDLLAAGGAVSWYNQQNPT